MAGLWKGVFMNLFENHKTALVMVSSGLMGHYGLRIYVLFPGLFMAFVGAFAVAISVLLIYLFYFLKQYRTIFSYLKTKGN